MRKHLERQDKPRKHYKVLQSKDRGNGADGNDARYRAKSRARVVRHNRSTRERERAREKERSHRPCGQTRRAPRN